MVDIGYAGAFLGGVATLLSPCAAMLLPAFFAYAFTSRTTLISRTGLFYVGLLLTLVPLGVAAGTAGALLTSHRTQLVLVASVIVIVLGLVQAAGVPLRLPGTAGMSGMARRSPGRDPAGAVSVLLLGAVYGVAGVCSGPILGAVLSVASLGGDPVYGGVLLAIYAAGMLAPVVVLALLWDRFDLGSRSWLRPRPVSWGPLTTTVGNLISGALFVAIGVLLLLTEGTAGLGGVLGATRQLALENRLADVAGAVPDVVIVLVVVGMGLLMFRAWAGRR